MHMITTTLSLNDLKKMAADTFGDIVKAVVDVDRELIAVDAELHADLEARLLEDGSQQQHLWGINLYPEASGEEFVEFDSMMNVRPSQDNRKKIIQIVGKRIAR